MDAPTAEPPAPPRSVLLGHPSRRRTIVLSAFVVVVALLLVSRHANNPSAPYSASSIAAKVQLTVVPANQVQQRIDSLAGPGRLNASVVTNGAQTLVGQITLTTPHNAPDTGQYAVFVIDQSQHKLVPQLWGTGPAGTRVTAGWDSHFNDVVKQVSWLKPLASVHHADGSTSDPGTALMFAPSTPGPITFQVVLDPSSLTVTDPRTALTVALVFLNTSGHVYWADNLTS